MDHQEIVDRIEALQSEHGDAYKRELARVRAETKSLQELCGGLGHVFSQRHPYGGLSPIRRCVFCDASEH